MLSRQRRRNPQSYHPPMHRNFSDLPEPGLLEHPKGPAAEERRRDLLACVILGVSLYHSPSELANHPQCLAEGNGRNPVPSAPPIDEETGDAPIGQLFQSLFVGLSAPYVRKFDRRAELAPAHRLLAVENERGVSPPFSHSLFFHFAVVLGRNFSPFWVEMEGDAPTSAEDSVMLLHETGEGWPSRGGEGLRG